MLPTLKQLRDAAGGLPNLTDEEIIQAVYPKYQRYYSDIDEFAKAVGYSGAGRGLWGNRLSASIDDYQANLYGLGGAISRALGAEDVGQWFDARREANEIAAAYATQRARDQGAIDDWREIGSRSGYISDTLNWIGGLGIRSLPYIGEVAVGGLAGRALMPATRAALGAARTAEEAAAARRALDIGSTIGGVAASYPSSVGEILSAQRESGGEDLGSAALGGIPYAALNAVGIEGAVARGGVARGALSSGSDAGLFKRMGVKALTTGAVEGSAEVGQEGISQFFGRMAVDPNETFFNEDANKRYLDAFIGGAALGGAFGAVGGIRRPVDDFMPYNLLERDKKATTISTEDSSPTTTLIGDTVNLVKTDDVFTANQIQSADLYDVDNYSSALKNNQKLDITPPKEELFDVVKRADVELPTEPIDDADVQAKPARSTSVLEPWQRELVDAKVPIFNGKMGRRAYNVLSTINTEVENGKLTNEQADLILDLLRSSKIKGAETALNIIKEANSYDIPEDQLDQVYNAIASYDYKGASTALKRAIADKIADSNTKAKSAYTVKQQASSFTTATPTATPAVAATTVTVPTIDAFYVKGGKDDAQTVQTLQAATQKPQETAAAKQLTTNAVIPQQPAATQSILDVDVAAPTHQSRPTVDVATPATKLQPAVGVAASTLQPRPDVDVIAPTTQPAPVNLLTRKHKRVVTPTQQVTAYISPETPTSNIDKPRIDDRAEVDTDGLRTDDLANIDIDGLSVDDLAEIEALTGNQGYATAALEEASGQRNETTNLDLDYETILDRILEERFRNSENKERNIEIAKTYLMALRDAPRGVKVKIQEAVAKRFGINNPVAVRKIGNTTAIVNAGARLFGVPPAQIRAILGIGDTSKTANTNVSNTAKTWIADEALDTSAITEALKQIGIETEEGDTAGFGYDDSRLYMAPENKDEAIANAIDSLAKKKERLEELRDSYEKQGLYDAVEIVTEQINEIDKQILQEIAKYENYLKEKKQASNTPEALKAKIRDVEKQIDKYKRLLECLKR